MSDPSSMSDLTHTMRIHTMRTHTVIDSPVGPLTLVNTDGVLSGLYMERQQHRPDPARFGPRTPFGFDQAAEELAEYFSGDRHAFSLPLSPAGNAFHRAVWRLLTEIPYCDTRTYGQLARDLGGDDADWTLARTVGTAIGRNPIGVVIPCHRVIGADGSLTGYAGGLERKAFLLALENPPAAAEQTLF